MSYSASSSDAAAFFERARGRRSASSRSIAAVTSSSVNVLRTSSSAEDRTRSILAPSISGKIFSLASRAFAHPGRARITLSRESSAPSAAWVIVRPLAAIGA